MRSSRDQDISSYKIAFPPHRLDTYYPHKFTACASSFSPSPFVKCLQGEFLRGSCLQPKQVSHGYGSHVHGKKLPTFKANPQRLSLNKEDSIWFLHFLFVQIEFLHAHATQDPSLPDVFYCSLIDWLNQASPLDQSTVNKDLYHIYHIYQWNKNRDVLLEKYCCSFGFCPIEGESPYLIIVTDATDAVSVNFSGRCKFLLI